MLSDASMFARGRSEITTALIDFVTQKQEFKKSVIHKLALLFHTKTAAMYSSQV
jgi:hypothetical protein